MQKVVLELSVSLDGYVAGPNDSPELPLGEGGERLFTWYNSGDTKVSLPGTDMTFKVSKASADFINAEWPKIGAMVAGRRMFDIAGAWGGTPPGGGNCFIVTHHPPQEWIKDGSPFTFVTDGVESAIQQAKKAAGNLNVSVGSASIAQQCLKAGLLDEIVVDQTPCLLGGGVRLFDNIGLKPVDLEIIKVVATPHVTHIAYRVIR